MDQMFVELMGRLNKELDSQKQEVDGLERQCQANAVFMQELRRRNQDELEVS